MNDQQRIAEVIRKRQGQYEAFAQFLQEENEYQNLTRISDTGEIFTRHFADSLASLGLLRELAEKEDGSHRLIDVGSGAGFPGLALAIALPDWEIVSVEATGKKAMFQMDLAEKLGLSNVKVLNVRAEKLAHDRDHREQYTAACARAMGHTRIVTEVLGGFVKPGGQLLAWKGPRLDEELPESLKTITKMGLKVEVQFEYSLEGMEDSDLRILVLNKVRETADRLPRDYAMIKNRPL